MKLKNIFLSILLVFSFNIFASDINISEGETYFSVTNKTLSEFSFINSVSDVVKNHFVDIPTNNDIKGISKDELSRGIIVSKANRIDIECVVRGYLAGSGWKEYQADQTVCGIKLPSNLVESSKLEEPIFTPSTKPANNVLSFIKDDPILKAFLKLFLPFTKSNPIPFTGNENNSLNQSTSS